MTALLGVINTDKGLLTGKKRARDSQDLLAERMRKKVESMSAGVTVSIGAADAALYQAKYAGRNRVVSERGGAAVASA